MGLLDSLNSADGIFALSLLDAAAPKAQRTSFGGGLLQALGNAQQYKSAEEEKRRRAEMQALQMQQIQQAIAQNQRQQQMQDEQIARGKADEGIMRQWFAPQAGPMPDGGNIPQTQVNPREMLGQGMSMGGLDQALKLNQMLNPAGKSPIDMLNKIDPKDYTPESFQAFMQSGNAAALRAVPKESAQPEAIRAIEAVFGPNSPQAIKAKQDYIAKITTHQPATQVSVSTEKPLMNSIASKLGEQIDASLSQARGATQAITTANTIREAIGSGKVIAGPGATFRVAGLQVGQMLGVGGKDAAEVLNNTRTVIQSMAKAELDAAQQMKGQGQITEAERDIIRRAASGNIDSLTTGEIGLLADAMEKTARFKIAAHRSNVRALSQMPNAAPILPFYQVEDPPAFNPGGQVRQRYNPVTGRIENVSGN